MRKILSGILFLTGILYNYGQVHLSGVVLDSATLQGLGDSYLSLSHDPGLVKSSNENGQFSFDSLEAGNYILSVSHIGCLTKTISIELKRDTFIEVYLAHHVHQFKEFTIYSHRNQGEPDTRIKTQISMKSIEIQAADQLSDVLQYEEGINFIRSGYNVSKPVIRGLHSNRIAIISGEAKLEGQQWGMEHAPEIDPLTSGNVELIKGAGSLLYCGDAAGGLMRLYPSDFADSSYSSYRLMLKGEFISLNSGMLGFKFENHVKNTGIGNRLAFSFKGAGDAAAPDYYLANTAYRQFSASHYLQYKKKGIKAGLNSRVYIQKPGILAASHIGNMSDLQKAFESDTPLISRPFSFKISAPHQFIEHYASNLNTLFKKSERFEWMINYQIQWNHRREFDVHGGEDEAALDLQLLSHQFYTRADHHFNSAWRQQYGMNAELQNNIYQGLYFIPNYQKLKAGGFYALNYEGSKSLIQAALRYDVQELETYRREGKNIVMNKFIYRDWSANVSGWFRAGEDIKLHYDLGSFYKFPDINELFANGLHHASAIIEKGDTQLIPERAYTFSLGAIYNHNRLRINIELFFSYFTNYIFPLPTGETELSIRGAFPVFAYTQSDVMFSGYDLNIRYALAAQSLIVAKHSFLYVRDLSNSQFIYGIPPNRIRMSFEQYADDLLFLENTAFKLHASYTFEQKRIEAGQDFIDPPNAYFLLDFEFRGEHPQHALTYFIKIDNMLNNRYRDYMNRYRYFADEVGTTITLSLNYTL